MLSPLCALSWGCGASEKRENRAMLPPLSMYFGAGRASVDTQLALIDEEISGTGLKLSVELWGKLGPGAPDKSLVLRGYEGMDALRRKVTAVRVATPYGVVMALGPLEAIEEKREATELVPALVIGEGGETAYSSGSDLNGDGTPDVVLRSTGGVMQIWGILSHGAKRYEILMEASPTRALDADGDGIVDFGGDFVYSQLHSSRGNDVLEPRWEDVAVWDKDRGHYWNGAEGARAWHRARLQALGEEERLKKAGIDYGDAMRLRYALQKAWHRRFLGETEAKAALKELDQEKVPDTLKEVFGDYRRRLERILERPANKHPSKAGALY